MLTIVKGIGLLLLTLACFSVFSLKFPKGSEAMSGMQLLLLSWLKLFTITSQVIY